jgi:hypothetical protein
MALHTNVGLGDFVLMEKIDMAQFVKNLKIRWVTGQGVLCLCLCVCLHTVWCILDSTVVWTGDDPSQSGLSSLLSRRKAAKNAASEIKSERMKISSHNYPYTVCIYPLLCF